MDAPHLASVLEVGDEIERIMTYDVRIAAAASMLGITVIAPA
ncbi:MAG: hypothetical protein ACP5P1_07565 [Acidimicrobiales bacterium]